MSKEPCSSIQKPATKKHWSCFWECWWCASFALVFVWRVCVCVCDVCFRASVEGDSDQALQRAGLLLADAAGRNRLREQRWKQWPQWVSLCSSVLGVRNWYPLKSKKEIKDDLDLKGFAADLNVPFTFHFCIYIYISFKTLGSVYFLYSARMH